MHLTQTVHTITTTLATLDLTTTLATTTHETHEIPPQTLRHYHQPTLRTIRIVPGTESAGPATKLIIDHL